MPQVSQLTFIAEVLERIGVEWMLTGSLASSMYGELRSTPDIDLVADLRNEHIPALVAEFAEPRFGILDIAYCQEWAAKLKVADLWQRIVREAEPIE